MAVSKKKIEAGLAVLKEGGEIRYMLEKNSYTGREQWQYALLAKGGDKVPGFGHAACSELKEQFCGLAYSTSVSSYYKLNAPVEDDPADDFNYVGSRHHY